MDFAPDDSTVGEMAEVSFSMSPSIAKIGAALARAQSGLAHAKADATNPHFNSKFADLASVIDAIGPALSANQIARYQAPLCAGDYVGVKTMLIHEDEWLASTLWCKPTQSTPQGIGTIISYLRRYSLAAVTGVAQVDDDGNAGSGKGDAPAAPARTRSKPPKEEAPKPDPREPPEQNQNRTQPPEPTRIAPVAPGEPTTAIAEGLVPVYTLRAGKWEHVSSAPPLNSTQQAAVKILQKELGIADDEWVVKLTMYYGKTSSTTLTSPEADDLKVRLQRRKEIQFSA